MNAHSNVKVVSVTLVASFSFRSPGASWTEGGPISNLTCLLLTHGY